MKTKEVFDKTEINVEFSYMNKIAQCIGKSDTIIRFLRVLDEYYRCDETAMIEIDYNRLSVKELYSSRVDNASSLDGLGYKQIEMLHRLLEQEEYICIEDEDVIEGLIGSVGTKSLMVIQIKGKNVIVGNLILLNTKESVGNFSLLKAMASFIFEDINKKKTQEELEYMCYIDPLTGLYNRNKYTVDLKRIEHRPLESLGVVFIDVDGLKQTNNVYGHAYGDYLIGKISKVLQSVLGNHLYRSGGDEFIALFENVKKDEFDEVVDKLKSKIKKDKDYTISIVSKWKEGEIDVFQEVSLTDDLMYIEKQSYYKTLLASNASHRTKLAGELNQEIEQGAFEVYLQPKIDLDNGEIVGAEALVRKRAKDGTLILPSKFLPMYEHEKIIRNIDLYVLECICKTLKEWSKLGQQLKISVNFSKVTFMEFNVVNDILEICEYYDVPTNWIEIEVTESTKNLDEDVLSKRVTQLKNNGFTVSLDDFGTHYSNLLMLMTTDFSQIKLDRSLIENLGKDSRNKVVVEHMVQMLSETNGAVTVAEGIENQEQVEVLKGLECNYGQGFLFAKPMPIPDFLEILLEQREKMVD